MSLDKLRQTLADRVKSSIPTQIFWCKAKEIDWEEKTMTADSLNEGEAGFFNIQLGIGSEFKKPKAGSYCLIGIIENDDTAPFLIWSEKLEEIDLIVGECEFQVKDGFLLKKENETLKKLMGDFIQACRNMVFQTNAGITIELLTDPEFEALKTRFNQFLK